MSKPTAKNLALAARDGKLDEMTELLKAGISPNEEVEYGGTSLHQAAAWGQGPAIELLLAHGAELESMTTVSATVAPQHSE
jgi:ankyrin repeat protein